MTTRPYPKKTCISFENAWYALNEVHLRPQHNRKTNFHIQNKLESHLKKSAQTIQPASCVGARRALRSLSNTRQKFPRRTLRALAVWAVTTWENVEENTETQRDSVTDDSYSNLSWQRRSLRAVASRWISHTASVWRLVYPSAGRKDTLQIYISKALLRMNQTRQTACFRCCVTRGLSWPLTGFTGMMRCATLYRFNLMQTFCTCDCL